MKVHVSDLFKSPKTLNLLLLLVAGARCLRPGRTSRRGLRFSIDADRAETIPILKRALAIGDCRGVVTIGRGGSVTRNEEYYALAHASRFVRPGSRRVASSAAVQDVENVAFRNPPPDGSVALVVLNAEAQSRGLTVRVAGGNFTYTMPGTSVATLVWR